MAEVGCRRRDRNATTIHVPMAILAALFDRARAALNDESK
jgi:hypothetical protein